MKGIAAHGGHGTVAHEKGTAVHKWHGQRGAWPAGGMASGAHGQRGAARGTWGKLSLPGTVEGMRPRGMGRSPASSSTTAGFMVTAAAGEGREAGGGRGRAHGRKGVVLPRVLITQPQPISSCAAARCWPGRCASTGVALGPPPMGCCMAGHQLIQQGPALSVPVLQGGHARDPAQAGQGRTVRRTKRSKRSGALLSCGSLRMHHWHDSSTGCMHDWHTCTHDCRQDAGVCAAPPEGAGWSTRGA